MPSQKYPRYLTPNPFTTIEGILMRVSDPGEYSLQDHNGVIDYFHLGIKTADGKRVMIFLNTTAMGWYGDFAKSKIWYWHPEKKHEIKTALANPSQFIGKRMKITGHMETLSEPEKKYRISNVQKVVIFLDPSSDLLKS